jgi:hypothetical protein
MTPAMLHRASLQPANGNGAQKKLLIRHRHASTSRRPPLQQHARHQCRPAALAGLHIDHQALADLADAASEAAKQSDLLSPLSDTLETVLKQLQDGLQTVNAPYTYGFSIILLTMIVKTFTFPLTKMQVRRLRLRCRAAPGGQRSWPGCCAGPEAAACSAYAKRLLRRPAAAYPQTRALAWMAPAAPAAWSPSCHPHAAPWLHLARTLVALHLACPAPASLAAGGAARLAHPSPPHPTPAAGRVQHGGAEGQAAH